MSTDPNTIKNYNDHAEEYHKHVSNPTDGAFHAFCEKPAIRAELPKLDNLEVISIGCGSGVDARWLADNGAKRVVGIDISKGLIDIAKANNHDLELYEIDMEKLDFPDASFDLAYSSLAIHYVDDWTVPLSEAHRVLRPGGKYIFSCGHPVDSGVEYEIINGIKYAVLGRKINQTTNERTVLGDYLADGSNGVKPVTGVLSGATVTVFHRPISKMVEEILASGFTIEKLVEPLPTEGLKDVDPNFYEQLRRVPCAMIWVLSKS